MPAAGTDLRIGIRIPVGIEEGDAVFRDMVVGGAGGASLTISGGGTVSGVEGTHDGADHGAPEAAAE